MSIGTTAAFAVPKIEHRRPVCIELRGYKIRALDINGSVYVLDTDGYGTIPYDGLIELQDMWRASFPSGSVPLLFIHNGN